MRLSSFEIKNVMSIVDSGKCYIDDNIMVLAGQNESGKTAILKSLDYFANGADDKFKKYAMRVDEEPEVRCDFKLEEQDWVDFPTEIASIIKQIQNISLYRKGTDRGSLFYTSETSKHLKDIINKNYSVLKQHRDNIFYETLEEREAREASGTMSSTDESTETEEINEEDKKKKLFDNLLLYLSRKMPTVVYYDSFSNLLPDEIEIDDIEDNQAVVDLQKILGIDFCELHDEEPRIYNTKIKRAEHHFKVDFNSYWQQTFLDDSDEYTIEIKPYGNEKLTFMIDRGNDTPLYFSQKSKGFQWFNAFYLRLQAMGVDSDNLKNNLLLIDEPGQGLHESAQKDVLKVLENLASRGLNIIYSTHHPLLINVDEHINRIRLVSNQKESGTKINTLSQFVSNVPKGQVQSDYTLSPIRTAMGLEKIQLSDDSINVIVEGITDKYYFDAFKILFATDESRKKIRFIPAAGAPSIKNITSILFGWGYDVKIVFDKHTTVEKELKKCFGDYIYEKQVKMLEQKGIEDLFSVNDFKTYVLPTDFEYNNEKCNSDNVKNGSQDAKKEVIARLFLDKVKTGIITAGNFDQETKENFESVFDWLDTQS